MDNAFALGPVPSNEDCEPADGDSAKIRREILAFIQQLKRQFSHFKNIEFKSVSNLHDLGKYREVCVVWLNRKGIHEALEVERNSPTDWDEQAIEFLGEYYKSKG